MGVLCLKFYPRGLQSPAAISLSDTFRALAMESAGSIPGNLKLPGNYYQA